MGGFITPPPGYFEIAVDIVRRYGGVFICDEVRPGGAARRKLNGIDHWDVEPDIVTYAKGLGNGVPVGATVATDEVADAVRGNTLSTFGGNPVSMAAAGAVLEVVERDNLAENAERVGAHLRAGLEDLAEAHPAIGDVRGKGLMQALEFVEDRGTKAPDARFTTCLLQKARDEGLLIGKGGLYGNCVRISPPLNIGGIRRERRAGTSRPGAHRHRGGAALTPGATPAAAGAPLAEFAFWTCPESWPAPTPR